MPYCYWRSTSLSNSKSSRHKKQEFADFSIHYNMVCKQNVAKSFYVAQHVQLLLESHSEWIILNRCEECVQLSGPMSFVRTSVYIISWYLRSCIATVWNITSLVFLQGSKAMLSSSQQSIHQEDPLGPNFCFQMAVILFWWSSNQRILILGSWHI